LENGFIITYLKIKMKPAMVNPNPVMAEKTITAIIPGDNPANRRKHTVQVILLVWGIFSCRVLIQLRIIIIMFSKKI